MGKRCVSCCVCLLAVKAQQLVPDVVVIGACAPTQKRKESPFTASAFLSSTLKAVRLPRGQSQYLWTSALQLLEDAGSRRRERAP